MWYVEEEFLRAEHLVSGTRWWGVGGEEIWAGRADPPQDTAATVNQIPLYFSETIWLNVTLRYGLVWIKTTFLFGNV